MAKYGLIGKSLAHSQSQYLHSLLGKYDYEMIELEHSSMLKEALRDESYDGFNVTVPYKQDVIQYLDELSDGARKAQAVNCIKRLPNGKLRGYNTDILGFEYMIGDHAEGRKCVILGTGGAARAAAVALENKGADSVYMVSRNPAAARERIGYNYHIISYNALHHYYDAEVVVNATPIGMHPDIDKSRMVEAGKYIAMFTELRYAVDVIYNPLRTKFLQDAKRMTDCKTKSGLDMLIIQAFESRNIWQGRPSIKLEETMQLKSIREKLMKRQLNIVAIGMPGSGKTTTFRRFAFENNLEFVDIDEETEKLMGEKIKDVLGPDGKGEEYFREKEFEAVREVSKRTSVVIASGGGSIFNPISRDLLRANGVVVYVKRPLENLAVKNRPISQLIGVSNLFYKRDRIYTRMSDLSIHNSGDFGKGGAEGNNAREYYKDMKSYCNYVKRRMVRFLHEIADNKWA